MTGLGKNSPGAIGESCCQFASEQGTRNQRKAIFLIFVIDILNSGHRITLLWQHKLYTDVSIIDVMETWIAAICKFLIWLNRQIFCCFPGTAKVPVSLQLMTDGPCLDLWVASFAGQFVHKWKNVHSCGIYRAVGCFINRTVLPVYLFTFPTWKVSVNTWLVGHSERFVATWPSQWLVGMLVPY